MKVINLLSEILSANKFTTENLPDLEKKLFFEGERRRPYLVRFTVLIFLSTIIASGGIVADSTATVIGAMIVAPLMTPILATTAALVMGRVKRATHSILIVIGGIIVVLLISWFIGIISTAVISFETNTQITSRISPNLNDLLVALAAGAAGAFAFSRDDVADSIPGVAIAIALVPPLCVVGISLSEAQLGAAIGASLLFLTNFLSILLAGGAVFALLNLGPAAIKGQDLSRQEQRKVYTYIGIGVLLVALPLAITSHQIARESVVEAQVKAITEDWLIESTSELKLSGVHADGYDVEIIFHGFSEPQLIEKLGADLSAQIPRLDDSKMTINVSRELPIPIDEEDG
jgi:uncharacterized hydrophobic protein (TIGR00271 family)